MSEEMNKLPAELAEVERALAGLTPAAGGVNRDQLMYDAGRASAMHSGRMRERLWQGACAVLVVVCAGLTVGLVHGTGNADRVGNVVVVPAKSTVPSVANGAPLPKTTVESLTAVPAADDVSDDAWAALKLLDAQRARLTGETISGSAGGSSASIPALRKGDGLEALPSWQRRSVIAKGNES